MVRRVSIIALAGSAREFIPKEIRWPCQTCAQPTLDAAMTEQQVSPPSSKSMHESADRQASLKIPKVRKRRKNKPNL